MTESIPTSLSHQICGNLLIRKLIHLRWAICISRTTLMRGPSSPAIPIPYRRSCCTVLSCFSRVWLCDPMDYSPPGSFVHWILLARILEWVAMPFLQGIFPTQGVNWSFLYVSCIGRWVLYHQRHLGSPRSCLSIFIHILIVFTMVLPTVTQDYFLYPYPEILSWSFPLLFYQNLSQTRVTICTTLPRTVQFVPPALMFLLLLF